MSKHLLKYSFPHLYFEFTITRMTDPNVALEKFLSQLGSIRKMVDI